MAGSTFGKGSRGQFSVKSDDFSEVNIGVQVMRLNLILSIIFLFSASFDAYTQFSFTPKPLPACRTFLIAEVAYNYRLTSSPTGKTLETRDNQTIEEFFEYGGSRYLTLETGLMRNISNHYAFGAAHFFGVLDEEHVLGGIKIRLRKWLANGKSIDISPGLILWNNDFPTTPAFTTSLDLKLKEWFAVTATYEFTPSHTELFEDPLFGDSYHTIFNENSALYVGLKTGSYPGLMVHAGAVIVGTILGFWYLLAGGD